MGLETITALKLISELIQTTSEAARKLKGTPKQRFGKTLIALQSILRNVQNWLSILVESLEKAEKTGSESEMLQVKNASTKFQHACNKFVEWIEKNKNFSHVLDLLSPEANEVLNNIVLYDTIIVNQADWIEIALFRDLEERVKQSKSKTALKRFKKDLKDINKQIETLKTEVRKLASANLSIEDLF